MQYQARAIILKAIKLGEADRILHLYSPDYGPIQAIAKSASRSKSSFGSKAQLMSYVDLSIAKGRNLDVISQAKLVDDFRHLKTNYEAMSAGYFFLEVLNSVAVNNDSYEQPFDILYKHLKSLDDATLSREQVLSVAVSFLWELIEYLGYKPDLDRCSQTNKKRAQGQTPKYFDFENGAICSVAAYNYHLDIDPYADSIRPLAAEVFYGLNVLDKNSEFDLWSFEGEEEDTSHEFESSVDLFALLNFLKTHLSYQIHKEFKTWQSLGDCFGYASQ